MTLLTGEIVEIYLDTWATMAKVRVGRAYTHAVLQFLPEAKVGDRVLVEGGVALAVVDQESDEEPG